jgi:hypothetical protein
VVPVVSAASLYLEKDRIFRDSHYCPAVAVPLILLGLLIVFVSPIRPTLSTNVSLSSGVLLALWIGAFILCYGGRSFRRASLPFLFILLIVPIPSVVLDKVVTALQAGSAEVSYVLFRATGAPVLGHGLTMSCPVLILRLLRNAAAYVRVWRCSSLEQWLAAYCWERVGRDSLQSYLSGLSRYSEMLCELSASPCLEYMWIGGFWSVAFTGAVDCQFFG